MGFFDKYPNTDFHEINMDWILAKIQALKDRVKGLEDAIHDIVVETPNDGKLTIKRNNTIVGDFTANQATDEDINIVVPENTSDLNNDSDFITSSDLPDMSDYYDKTETDNLLNDKADISSLSSVATTGNYNDLSNKPTIPAAQVNSDWNANSGVAEILNKPPIPTVNDGTLTIQRNGTTLDTFTANSSANKTVNIQCEPPITWTPVSQNGWNSYTDSAGYVHMYRHSQDYTYNFNTQEGAVYLTTLDNWALSKDPSKLIYAEANAICPNKLIGVQFNSFTSTNFTTYYYGFTPGSATFSVFLHLVYRP